MPTASSDTPTETGERYVGSLEVTNWATPLGRGLADAHHRLASRIGPRRALTASLVAGGALAVGASFLAARVYDAVADDNGIERVDRPILHRAMRLRSAPADATAAGIARVFGPVGMPILTLAVAGLLAASRKSATPVLMLGAAGVGSVAMTLAGKDLIKRHRPPHRDAIPPYEYSPSFPSGHTLNATTIAGVVAYLLVLRQKRTLPQATTVGAAVGTAVTVGLSRVLLGAHWFTDVLVGWITGSGWVALILTSHRLYLTSRQRHESEEKSKSRSDTIVNPELSRRHTNSVGS